MGRCPSAVSKCMPCLVAHVPPFSRIFQRIPDKRLIDSLSWWHKFLVDDPPTFKKTNEHRFDFLFNHSRFLGTGRFCSVPLPTLALCYGVVLKNPLFISRDNANEDLWLPLKAVKMIRTHIAPIGLMLSREVLLNHHGASISHVKILVKILQTVNGFKFYSLLIFLNVNR